MYAQSSEFFFARRRIHPNAVLAIDSLPGDAEIDCCAEHHFFELLDVPPNIASMLSQIQYRIAHDLPRTVIGDVAAAVGHMALYIHLREQIIAGPEVLALSVSAERDNVRMLAE